MSIVHVIKAYSDWPTLALPGDTALSRQELDRLSAMHQLNQPAFVSGRLLLRQMLAEALDVKPGDVPLTQEGAGRVHLDHPKAGSISFSVSHSGEGLDAYIAVAVSKDGKIGVDLDRVDRDIDWRRIAERHMHTDNLNYLNSLTGASATRAFYQYWTLTEALVKLEDGKLLPYLHNVAIDLENDQPSLKSETPGGNGAVSLMNKLFFSEGLMLGVVSTGATVPMIETAL
jgi:4'-phosphopantetheinyl transferase